MFMASPSDSYLPEWLLLLLLLLLLLAFCC
jgi:hypothetical protein